MSTMSERLCMWAAWKMPRCLVYWCTVRLGAYATTNKYSSQVVHELTFMDALKRWPNE
jgi:hypothetical protein